LKRERVNNQNSKIKNQKSKIKKERKDKSLGFTKTEE